MDIRLVGITLKDALDIVFDEGEDAQEVSDIYVEPPESNVLTDEDSADDDEAGVFDNLSRRQLAAGAEIVMSDQTRIGGVDEIPIFDQGSSSSAQPSTSRVPTFNSGVTLSTGMSNMNFDKSGDLHPSTVEFPKGDYSKYATLSCVEMFELFFSEDLLQEFSRQTNSYALFKNSPLPNISVDEIKVFLGILILSGYNSLPSKRSYWEFSNDMRNELVVEAMRRDRFLQISRFIHFADIFDTLQESYKSPW